MTASSDRAGTDRVGANSLRRGGDWAGLGNRRSGGAGVAEPAGAVDGRSNDHRAAVLSHQGNGEFNREKCLVQIDRESFIRFVDPAFAQGSAEAVHPGGGENHVDATEAPLESLEGASQGSPASNICRQRKRGAACHPRDRAGEQKRGDGRRVAHGRFGGIRDERVEAETAAMD